MQVSEHLIVSTMPLTVLPKGENLNQRIWLRVGEYNHKLDRRHGRTEDSALPWWEQVKLKCEMKGLVRGDPFPSAWARPKVPQSSASLISHHAQC